MLSTRLFQGVEHQPFLLQGGQPAALLVHGFPGTPAEMLPLGQAFQRSGWTARGLLLPGFGAQIASLSEKTAQDWLQAIVSSLQEMRGQHTPLILVGFSMGGGLAIQAAARCAVDGLVLISPFTRATGIFWKLIPIIKYIFPTIRPFRAFKIDPDDERTRRGLENFFAGVDLSDPDVQKGLRDFSFPVSILEQVRNAANGARKSAPQVAAPVKVLQGSRDPVIRPESTRSLLQLFAGRTEYMELPGAHDLPRPDQPDWPRVQEAVIEFAEKLLNPAHGRLGQAAPFPGSPPAQTEIYRAQGDQHGQEDDEGVEQKQ